MRAVYLATTRERKFMNMSEHFRLYNDKQDNDKKLELVWKKIELPEPRGDLEKIARAKASYAFQQLSQGNVTFMPTLTWDIGFYIHSLNGFPEAYPHWAIEKLGTDGFIRLLEGKERICEFRNCVAYNDGIGITPCFPIRDETNDHKRGVSKGIIATQARGKETEWDLHRLFVPDGWDNKTIAEIISDGKYQDYRIKTYQTFFESIAEWINEKIDWFEH